MTGRFRLVVLAGSVALLSACEEGAQFNPFQANGDGPTQTAASAQATVVERDREAPEVFSTQEAALWDGRPSLGGVWVAHPEVDDPQRVMIRNLTNDKFVIGALFRRERDNPGPLLQVSSDAAAELGILAGKPTDLSVVAIIREEVTIEPDVSIPLDDGEIEASTLGDPVADMAAAAITAATAPKTKPVARPSATPAPAPVAAAPVAAAPATAAAVAEPAGNLAKPFIQIGIFNVEANANQVMEMLRNSGIIPTVKTFSSDGKDYWRVVVGPVTNATERRQMIARVRGLGFSDAYAVTD